MAIGGAGGLGATLLIGGGVAATGIGALVYVVATSNPAPDPAAASAPVAVVDASVAADPAQPVPPEPSAPSFDIVRIEPSGAALLAGRSQPGATVAIALDGAEIDRVEADAGGAFVAMLQIDPAEVPRILTLDQYLDDGIAVPSEQSVIVAPAPVAEMAAAEPTVVDVPAAPAPDAAPELAVVVDSDAPPVSAAPAVAPAADAPADIAAEAQPTVPAEAVPELADAARPAPSAPVGVFTSPDPTAADDAVASLADPASLPVTRSIGGGPIAIDEAIVSEEAGPIAGPVAAVEAGPVGSAPDALSPDEDQAEIVDAPAAQADPAPDVGVVDPVEVASGATPDPAIPIVPEAVPPETIMAEAEAAAEPVAADPPGPETGPALPPTIAAAEVAPAELPVDALPSPMPTDPAPTDVRPAAPAIVPPATQPPAVDVTALPEAPVPPESLARAALPEAATPPAPPVAAPVVILSEPDGIRVLQTGGSAEPPAPGLGTTQIVLDTISYDAAGDVVLAGRGRVEGGLRIYLDNQPIPLSGLARQTDWEAQLPQVDPGTYILRIDALAADGTVASRVETPFLREAPEDLPDPGDGAVVTVQPGNTLWGISRDRFGEGILYVHVYDANRDQIRDPDLIYPGQIFEIPELPPVTDEG